MSRFTVKVTNEQELLNQMDSLLTKLTWENGRIQRIRLTMRSRIQIENLTGFQLQHVSDELVSAGKKINAGRSALEEIFDLYRKTEEGLCNQPGRKSSDVKIAKVSMTLLDQDSVHWPFSKNPQDQDEDHLSSSKSLQDQDDDHWYHHATKKFEKSAYIDKGGFHRGESESEKAAEKEKEKAKASEPDINLTLFEKSYSKSALGNERTASSKYGKASASYDVGKREASFSVYGGKGSVGVDAGASYTVFTAEEEAQLGTDNLGVYVKSTQTAGKVGADVKAQAGLLDQNGKFDPVLYAGLSAQAIAGEVTGQAGAKVAGADVAVKGSLNYGIGADLNAGFHDGKVQLKAGLTLGVGVAGEVDVDLSGTIKAFKAGADRIRSGIDEIEKMYGR